MQVGSFNIRGLGGRVKQRKVKNLIVTEKIDFMMIQETKMAGIEESFYNKLWGSSEFQWSSLDSNGAPGGLLNLWNKEKLKMIFTFSGDGFCGIRGLWGVNNNFGRGLWILAGDFNAVLRGNERKGCSSQEHRVEIDEFQSFVKDMELVDLPLLGRRYTWFKSNGSAMSRLDRFFYLKNGCQSGRIRCNGL